MGLRSQRMEKKKAKRFGDPPLSDLGHKQARETGKCLDSILSSNDCSNQSNNDHGSNHITIDSNNDSDENECLFVNDGSNNTSIIASHITVLCSPFLRCIQTANGILSQFVHTPGDVASNVVIYPEKSIWEYDARYDDLHACLPDMEERACYYPRLDPSHESLFVPSLPESQSEFMARCKKAVKSLNKQYPYKPDSVIILVTHAAGCIGLTKEAAGVELSDINPSYPCGIFGMTRTSNTDHWDLDPYTNKDGLNGHMSHLSNVKGETRPWHRLGPHFTYSGPKAQSTTQS